jgi:hypothetical protein
MVQEGFVTTPATIPQRQPVSSSGSSAPYPDGCPGESETKANMLDFQSGTSRRLCREVSNPACGVPIIMDEGRKRVLLIAASILAARKLAQWDGGKRVPATVAAISDAVRWAEEIMRVIDDRWPEGVRKV